MAITICMLVSYIFINKTNVENFNMADISIMENIILDNN